MVHIPDLISLSSSYFQQVTDLQIQVLCLYQYTQQRKRVSLSQAYSRADKLIGCSRSILAAPDACG